MYAHEFTATERKKFPSFASWSGGSLPLMARGRMQDGRRYVVAFCPDGAFLIIKPNDLGLCLPLPFPTQLCAKALAKGMGLPGTLADFRDLGFRAP